MPINLSVLFQRVEASVFFEFSMSQNYPYSSCVPRFRDVAVVTIIHALRSAPWMELNEATQDEIALWLLKTVCFFHRIPEESLEKPALQNLAQAESPRRTTDGHSPSHDTIRSSLAQMESGETVDFVVASRKAELLLRGDLDRLDTASSSSVVVEDVADERSKAIANPGFCVLQQFLKNCLVRDYAAFNILLQKLIHVLPSSSSTHYDFAELFGERSSVDVVSQASSAAGDSIASFLILQKIAFRCASLQRQCEVLRMCQAWREELCALEPVLSEDDAQAREALLNCEDISPIEGLLEAMDQKNLSVATDAIHSFFERKPAASPSGKTFLELCTPPSKVSVPPSHFSSFLFGVPHVAPGVSPISSNASSIHFAVSCGILTTAQFYLSLRSTRTALQCAEMAVLNGHHSSNVDMLAMGHLMRYCCYIAAGYPAAGAEDVAIALQLSSSPSSGSQFSVKTRCLAFMYAAELLVNYPSNVDPTLRAVIIKGAMSLSNRSNDTADPSDGAAVEVVQTIAQSVLGGARRSSTSARDFNLPFALLESSNAVLYMSRTSSHCCVGGRRSSTAVDQYVTSSRRESVHCCC